MQPDDPRHGQYAGAVAHWLDGERPCNPCAKAETRYRKQRKLRHLQGDPPMVPSIGLIRRYEALHAIGYTGPQIAEAADISINALRSVRYHGSDLVRTGTFKRLADAYERLCMTIPDGQYANRARSIARRRGWSPPLAWDDIDDPAAKPQGAAIPPGVPGRPTIRDAQIADAEWMADADETLTSACARLGIKPDSLWAACKRAGRMDVYDRLASREANGLNRADMRNRKRDAA